MTMQFNRFPFVCLAISATCLLSPSTASAAWLPGWGSSDGTPGVYTSWCSATNERLYLGDFDGDGATDLLCHGTIDGEMRIDFSYERFRGFWGTDWNTATESQADHDWCTNAGEYMHIGDYNGDGKDDLMCRVAEGYTNEGRKRIDFANFNGEFYGANFDTLDFPSAAQAWCTNDGESTFVGDFDGDGKDDLLCYADAGATYPGRKRIDYANSEGTFFGTEYDTVSHPEVAQSWCTNAGESLYVGDFDGNGKDDLLCHVNRGYTNAGRRRIDFYNSTSEPFAGTDFNSDSTSTPSWCAQLGDELHIGDANADGKEDLLCANWQANSSYGSIRVDHANSAGTFFGTNGDLHDEEWCKSSSKNFYVGDFDADGGTDVLCHDPSSGYRGIRYVNAVGDFFSVCSEGSVLGDGALPALPVHFAVVANPSHPDVPERSSLMPTSISTHVYPFHTTPGTTFNQTNDPSLYFELEVDVMNTYTRTYFQSGVTSESVCVGSDCIFYEYETHTFYHELAFTSCGEVKKYANPSSATYASNCFSNTQVTDKSTCYPNVCNGNYTHDDNWNSGFACAIRECTDRKIRKPHALNVIVMDRCDWDANTNGISNDSCEDFQSFGFGKALGDTSSWGATDFFTAWDYHRMLVGDSDPNRDRNGSMVVNGLEQHELGHVLDLGHTTDCSQERNAMDKSSGCSPDSEIWRDAGYTNSIQGDNQLTLAVTAARNAVVEWSCN